MSVLRGISSGGNNHNNIVELSVMIEEKEDFFLSAAPCDDGFSDSGISSSSSSTYLEMRPCQPVNVESSQGAKRFSSYIGKEKTIISLQGESIFTSIMFPFLILSRHLLRGEC